MAEEENKDPQWKAGELEPNKPVNIVLESAKAIATGESKFGTWNLWLVNVENQKVFNRNDKNPVVGYTGKAMCFPSAGLHEQFLKATNGTQENVKMEVSLVPKKGKGGFYTTFETKIIEGGITPPNNLQHDNFKFLEDFKTFVENKVIKGTKEDMINFGVTDQYKIPKEELEKLWVVYNEKKE